MTDHGLVCPRCHLPLAKCICPVPLTNENLKKALERAFEHYNAANFPQKVRLGPGSYSLLLSCTGNVTIHFEGKYSMQALEYVVGTDKGTEEEDGK
jgi:hypothetical protein